ncbi:hypothetical protein [Streptomyces sp. NPDC053427]|uniref:hypothetical protein n=1 Tax=Streptomyces sp. NPDC053427 TaxID=3365701 RepID=UPI0037D7B6EC
MSHREERPDVTREIPDDTELRILASKTWLYKRAMVVISALVPWIFIRVAWRDSPGLLWIPVLNLIATYVGIYLVIRRWRGPGRRLYPAVAGVVACWAVCIELLRLLK